MKERIRICFITTCVSYTLMMLLQTLFYMSNHADISNQTVLEILGICLIINVFINFTHYLNIKEWVADWLSIIEINIVILIANYLAGAKITWLNVLVIFIASIGIYFICNGVLFIKNNKDAKRINEKLKNMQEK